MSRVLTVGTTIAAMLFAGDAGAAASSTSFVGTVLSRCTLTLGTAGVLALSEDGQTLSSELPGGVSAKVALVTTGAEFQLEVDPLNAFASAPPGGQADQMSMAFSASGASLFTEVDASQPLRLGLGLTNVDVDLTAEKNDGVFPAGLYRSDVVLRCAPR